MKLFVRNNRGEKIYLNMTAHSKSELMLLLRGSHFNFGSDELFTVNQVIAESENESNMNTAIGAVLGGIVGILGGPGGMVIGASLGGILGNTKDLAEKRSIETFNNSLASW